MRIAAQDVPAQFETLLEVVASGEEVVVVRNGEAVATISAAHPTSPGSMQQLTDDIRRFRAGVDLHDFDLRAAIDEGRK